MAFYISGHGFGHASREIEVINALGLPARGQAPPEIVIRSSAPRWLFDRTVRVPFTLLPDPTDTGVVQIDSLRLDEAETIRQAREFYDRLPARSASEAALLRQHDARVVIADAPPLACAAAAAAAIPSIVLSNFTWDWIYEGYPEALQAAPELITLMQEAYSHASAGWRLPLSGGFETVRNVSELPFIARHARHGRHAVRHGLALPDDRPLALSSFGGYGVHNLDLSTLDCLDRVAVVVTGTGDPGPLPDGIHFVDERRMYEAGLRYEDLVAAADVVVTKPGYGIISECIANGTAMLYTSRGRFREYEVMVAEMPRHLRCGFISHGDLFAGRWARGLDQVLARPAADRVATNGATVAAGWIRDFF